MSSTHARSWGPDEAAAIYELGRPDYPDALTTLLRDEIGLGPSSLVADVAAGTGKLTRVLATGPFALVAVEPMAGMRAQLGRAVPGIPRVAGTAEQLPLRDGCVAAVTVAQAFHWFRVDEASRELRRVLAPGGTLALINNTRAAGDTLSRRLWEILRSFEHLAPRPESTQGWRARLDRAGDFVHWRTFELPHDQVMHTPEELEARFTSISFVLLLNDPDRARLTTALHRAAGDEYPIRLPLKTVVELGSRA